MGFLEIIVGIEQLIAEGWTRFFVIIASVALIDNISGGLINVYPLKSLIETVIHIWISEFYFPVYFGVSTLLITVVVIPFAIFLFKSSFN